ncbi:MAG: ComF family protein [Bacteroidales bacterium]|nr:ComF family protein [Bacteroidales bacterium]
MIETLKHILQSVFFTIFPRKCLFCGNLLNEKENKFCSRCSELYPYPTDIDIDEFYAPLAPYITGICILGHYSYCKIPVKQFKFEENIYAGKQLANMLCEKLSKTVWIDSIDMIIPVPLHWIKQRQRGFNQSEIIARVIAKRFHKKVVADNLFRTTNNKAQHTSNQMQRYENVRGIFKVKDPLAFENKNVLIVDDIITTCSTVLECCKEIKKTNVTAIYICAIASDREII